MPFKKRCESSYSSPCRLGLRGAFRLAQSGNAGAVRGTVTDPSGAVIPDATVHLTNGVSGFDRTVSTDRKGQFTFSNVPFNTYKISVSANRLCSVEPKRRDSFGSGHEPEAGDADCRRHRRR